MGLAELLGMVFNAAAAAERKAAADPGHAPYVAERRGRDGADGKPGADGRVAIAPGSDGVAVANGGAGGHGGRGGDVAVDWRHAPPKQRPAREGRKRDDPR